jgi:chloramphenicol 3-O-phosphotransferase
VNNTPKYSTKDPSVKQAQIVLVISGIAAGKSTLARKLQNEQFAGFILVDIDQFILTMAEYWKLRAVHPAGAYRRVYSKARELAYKALAGCGKIEWSRRFFFRL